ncbi:hypothetical protein KQI52_15060 [bacterium]|nr:hypothetical protein [bacterium]
METGVQPDAAAAVTNPENSHITATPTAQEFPSNPAVAGFQIVDKPRIARGVILSEAKKVQLF